MAAWREAQLASELLALQQRRRVLQRRSAAQQRLAWIVATALVVIVGVPLLMRSWPAAAPQPPASAAGVTAGALATASTEIPVEPLSTAAAGAALDEGTVRERLGQYASAYASLSVSKTADVWPSVDRAALGQAFAALRSVDLTFDRCDVDLAGARATARCAGILTYVRRIGPPDPITAKQAWLFDLRRSGGDWWIQQVSSSLGQGQP